jgi:K+-transporting ATPase ATPase C chain
MIRELIVSLRGCAITFVVCAVAYPAIVWGTAQLCFPTQAEGSLMYGADGRTVIGSVLVAQRFDSPGYFHPRPSVVQYKADAAGGSNLGTNNPDLRKAIVDRLEALGAGSDRPVPVDLVTASGSGLDPDISLAAAFYQAPRVASHRGLPIENVRALIDRQTNRSGGLIGAPPRINVLLLNQALDQERAMVR